MKRFLLAVAALAAVCLLAYPASAQIRLYKGGWRSQADKWRGRFEHYSVDQEIGVDPSDLWTQTVFVPEGNYIEKLPTSTETDDECLHPGVLKIPHGWPDSPRTANTRPYWMVMSPFNAASGSQIENPEILHSADGITWTVPAGLTNPITPYPGAADGSYHSDPALICHAGRLYCYYRHADAAGDLFVRIMSKNSTDGVNWSAADTVLADESDDDTIIAPIIRNVRGTFYLWYVDANADPNELHLRKSTSPTGPFGAATTCTLNGISSGDALNGEYWHGDIRYVGGQFFCLACFKDYPGPGAGNFWLFGVSEDGETWEFDIRPGGLPPYQEGLYDAPPGHIIADGGEYMPSMLWNPNERSFDVYASIMTTASAHRWIVKCKLFLLPNARYSFEAFDQYLLLLYEDGLLEGFWPFIQSGGTTIYDYSRKTNDLTPSENFGAFDTRPELKNPVHTVSFNGSDEGADRADDADFTFGDGTDDDAMSVGFWINVGDLAASADIISKDDTNHKEWRIRVKHDEKLSIIYYDNSAGGTAYEGRLTSAALAQDQWHFCVVTCAAEEGETKSDFVKWYVDGTLVGSAADDGAGTYTAMEDKGAKLCLGHHLSSGAPVERFVGDLAMPFVLRQELSAVDVYKLWLLGSRMLNLPNVRHLGP